MQAIEANGLIFHAEFSGPPAAPMLVFINSLGTDYRLWSDTIAELGGGYRILRYDFRGHGLSDCPAGPYSMKDHVADLAGILDTQPSRSVVLCGVSIGGMIAQGLALRQPGRVDGLVLSNTGCRIGDADTWTDRVSVIEASGLHGLAEGVMARWFSPAFLRERPLVVQLWRNMFLRTPVDGYVASCAALRDADFTDQVETLSIPALCIGGSEDGATPPDVVRALAERMPRGAYHEIEGVGHLPGIERPDRMAALIDSFLRENGIDGTRVR